MQKTAKSDINLKSLHNDRFLLAEYCALCLKGKTENKNRQICWTGTLPMNTEAGMDSPISHCSQAVPALEEHLTPKPNDPLQLAWTHTSPKRRRKRRRRKPGPHFTPSPGGVFPALP